LNKNCFSENEELSEREGGFAELRDKLLIAAMLPMNEEKFEEFIEKLIKNHHDEISDKVEEFIILKKDSKDLSEFSGEKYTFGKKEISECADFFSNCIDDAPLPEILEAYRSKVKVSLSSG